MTFGSFVLDRLGLIVGFLLSTALLLLIVHLSVARLDAGTVGYFLLLAGLLGALNLLVGYWRQRRFRQEVAARLRTGATLEAAPLTAGRTREQRALVALVEGARRAAAYETQLHRTAVEEHRAFVDLWVHQMKTPVTVLELTAREARDSPSAWESVQEEVASLAHGLDLMLNSARLERFNLDLSPAEVDLASLTRQAVNELKASWLRSGVYPNLVVPDAPVLVETDAKWLLFVLRQLLVNAIKYSQRGARVSLRVESSGTTATVSVSDEGIGIPPEDLPRIFERYFTGRNGRLRSASTGMGLYLVERVCAKLGHGVEVASRVGAGTTFTLTLRTEGLHRLTG